MKIKTHLCDGYSHLEKFLNEEIDYKGFRPEYIILGITQNNEVYTVIYKDFS
jgi:hypothetical protein